MCITAIDEVLDFAIEREQEAHEFYIKLAQRMAQQELKDLFQQLAREELGHKAKLQNIKNGKLLLLKSDRVMDLKIADYLVEVNEESAELDLQKALIIAMQREKASFRLYNDLAELTGNPEVKTIFLALAQEEARHKLRFEIEYDELVLVEN